MEIFIIALLLVLAYNVNAEPKVMGLGLDAQVPTQ